MEETADVQDPEVERQDPNGGAIDCKQVQQRGGVRPLLFIARRDPLVTSDRYIR